MGRRELIMIAATNQRKGSVVDAPLPKKYICRLQVKANHMGDCLPIIPQASRVIGKKVLFRLEMEAAVADKYSGSPAAGILLQFKSLPDKAACLNVAGPTDGNGKTRVVLETREQGEYDLTVKNPDVKMEEFPVTIKEAWYEALFLLTHYVMYEESSTKFRGQRVDAYNGIRVEGGNRHKRDFLREVKMQGSGRTDIPDKPVLKYIAEKNEFRYLKHVIGCKSTILKSNYSIAVDHHVLPYFHKVTVYFPTRTELGLRHAEDTGERIKGHHFDLFMASEAEAKGWVNAHGGKIFGAYVKYLGGE